MNELNPMEKIKQLRQRLGLSQEELAEESGLSLRTIQRIENGETEPRGDSLKRISIALRVTPNEIVDWAVQEDRAFLSRLNLASLTFLLFPVLGIIIPATMWSTKKKTVKDAEQTGKEIFNFQVTWNILLFLYFLFTLFKLRMIFGDAISPTMIVIPVLMWAGIVLLYLCNIILIMINQVRIFQGKRVKYFPKINFIR